MNISQRKREADGRSRRAGEEQAAGVTVLLARAVRLAGVSRSAQPTWLRQQTCELRCRTEVSSSHEIT